ncbi:hypothetical protein RR48_08252 [Papilio machaon]|uniref:Uncharacterized protein n=1 Tax=Papilio machaon TaxID=76193 RepID=A0A194RF84_PAPMA|nr:hypothetical protein RR48_08252 [Papilio machaon]
MHVVANRKEGRHRYWLLSDLDYCHELRRSLRASSLAPLLPGSRTTEKAAAASAATNSDTIIDQKVTVMKPRPGRAIPWQGLDVQGLAFPCRLQHLHRYNLVLQFNPY